MDNRNYPRKIPVRRSGRPWYFYLVYFLALFFMLTSAWIFYIMKTQHGIGPIKSPWGPRNQIGGMSSFNMIIAGLDDSGDSRRTDSLIVAHVNMTDRYVTLVSVPRDSRVEIPGHGMDKINAAFAIGGPELCKRTLEQFLGIPIQFYFVMYVSGFVKVIDAMGGVDINVEKRLRYNDNAQNLHIDLQPGQQHLDGTQAMGYARFRHDAQGDFGRIARQQNMINALGRKALSIGAIRGLPTLFQELLGKKMIVTNLSLGDAYALKNFYNDQVRQNTRMFMFPGVPQDIGGVSYVIPDRTEIPYVSNGIFNEGGSPKNKEIKIEVKNGCGYRGVAENYARRLTYYGFDVLGTSNADSFDYDHSIVVVYKPNPFDGAVARVMQAEIVRNSNMDAIPHMDVIVGRDKLHIGE